jgi:hypothetical protein
MTLRDRFASRPGPMTETRAFLIDSRRPFQATVGGYLPFTIVHHSPTIPRMLLAV